MNPDLVHLSEPALRDLITAWGEKPFRVGQIRAWLYQKGARSVDAMTDLPRGLRERLSAAVTVGELGIAAEQTSKDGTVKRLYRLTDGQLVESRADALRATAAAPACISSQAGCAMGCVFCATGQMGFVAPPHAHRDRRAGRCGSRTSSCGWIAATACPTSCSWAWASPSTTTTPSSRRSAA
jgi:adenine C2-methylase RlmN of 23S rRNA A2503 and tRNA A37